MVFDLVDVDGDLPGELVQGVVEAELEQQYNNSVTTV
jgi:hypothetical protein